MNTESGVDLATHFEIACNQYFAKYGNRQARELPAKFWLAHELALRVGGDRVVCEVNVCKEEVCANLGTTSAELKLIGVGNKKSGKEAAINFDICIAENNDYDARAWKTLRKKNVHFTKTALSGLTLIAELKLSRKRRLSASEPELLQDILKLKATSQSYQRFFGKSCITVPPTYLVIHHHAQESGIDIDAWNDSLKPHLDNWKSFWIDALPAPSIITRDPSDASKAKIYRNFRHES